MYLLRISREIIFASTGFWVMSGSFSRKLPCQYLSHPASWRTQHCNYSLTLQDYEIATCLLITFPLTQWAQSQVLRMQYSALYGCRQALQVTWWGLFLDTHQHQFKVNQTSSNDLCYGFVVMYFQFVVIFSSVVVMYFQHIFSGMLINTTSIQTFISWMKNFSISSYSARFSAHFIQTIFQKRTPSFRKKKKVNSFLILTGKCHFYKHQLAISWTFSEVQELTLCLAVSFYTKRKWQEEGV